MKTIAVVLAILIILGIFYGIGYIGVEAYGLLNKYWGLLDPEWQAIMVVFSVILIFCSLLVSVSLRAPIKQFGMKGTGKVMAYNDFVTWYSALKEGDEFALDIKPLKLIVNKMILWGNKQVSRQAKDLYEAIQDKSSVTDELLLEKAEYIYLEIRRELGLRGSMNDNPIV